VQERPFLRVRCRCSSLSSVLTPPASSKAFYLCGFKRISSNSVSVCVVAVQRPSSFSGWLYSSMNFRYCFQLIFGDRFLKFRRESSLRRSANVRVAAVCCRISRLTF